MRHPAGVFGLLLLSLLVGTALLADEIASDLPVAVRIDGRTHWLAGRSRPPALRGETVRSLGGRLDPARGEWMVSPLVPWGPNETYGVARVAGQAPAPIGAPPWPPDEQHLFGTDELGRDVLARVVHGARVSLLVACAAVALYVVIGVLLGATAGYFGGAPDLVVSRVIEVMATFPTLFFLLAVMGLTGTRSTVPLIGAIALTRWTEVARLVRAEVLQIRKAPWVDAARTVGAGHARLLVHHVLPNALAPVWVAAPFGVAAAIVLETGLSFLGFGVPPPTPSWGELLTQAHRYLTHPGAWWLTLYPGVAILLTVSAFNLLGTALRDLLDPRLRE